MVARVLMVARVIDDQFACTLGLRPHKLMVAMQQPCG